jgi:DNA-binding XRE family transcriptional regulator
VSAFSCNVRRLRREAGLSYAQLAAKLSLPVTTVTAWETKQVTQPRTPLAPLAAVFGITPAQLLEAPAGLGGTCDVWRVIPGRPCGESPARPFRAECACGHDMAGLACNACLGSQKPGCLTCWRTKHHKCAVSLAAAELAGAK